MLRCSHINCSVCHRRLLECIKKGANKEAQSLLKKLKNPQDTLMSSGSTLLHYAANCGNVSMVQHFVEQRFNVDLQDDYGATPLMMAIKNRNVTTVKVLLNSNANIYMTDFRGISTLQYAFESCMSPWDIEFKRTQQLIILEVLLEAINRDFSTNEDTTTQWFLNKANNVVKLIAVVFGNVKLAEIILRNGYPINFQEPRRGETAVSCAIIFVKLENAKFLIKSGADINIENKLDRSPISYYAGNFELADEKSEVLQSLLRKINSTAAYNDRVKAVETLLQHGKKKTVFLALQSDIGAVAMKFTRPFLHLIVSNKNDDVLDALDEFCIDFSVNERASDGDTALLIACAQHGSHKKVEYLLNHGADVSLTRFNGHSALFIVAFEFGPKNSKEDRGAAKIAEMLLQHGADAQFHYHDMTFLDLLSVCPARLSTTTIVAYLALRASTDASYLTEDTRRKLAYYPYFKLHFDLCTKQIQEMRTIGVYEGVTLFQLLTENEGKIVTYARNRALVAAFKRTMKNKLYYTYIKTLRKRIANASRKIELDRKAAAAIETLTGLCSNAYHLIVYKIIGYLKRQDLQRLCKIENFLSVNM